MKAQPFDAIIFDHDGTLVDTESPDYEACRIMCKELGIVLSMADWARIVIGRMDGYNTLFTEVIQPQLKNGFTQDDMWQRLRELWPITLQDTGLMPGVNNLLAQLYAQGNTMAVATAADRNWALRWLTNFNHRHYFQAKSTGDDVPNNKPAPDVYLHAAAQLGAKPQRCLVFEDSLVGVQSAKSAGMIVVAVPGHITQSLDFSRADATIAGLDKIDPQWIDDFRQQIS